MESVTRLLLATVGLAVTQLAIAQSQASDCPADAIKSDVDSVGIRLGDALCSRDLVNAEVPNASFLALSKSNSFGSDITTQPIGKLLADAVELATQQTAKSDSKAAYVSVDAIFSSSAVPERYQGVTVSWLIRGAAVSTPEALISRVSRKFCATDRLALEPGGAMQKALRAKYGDPSEVRSNRQALPLADAQFKKTEAVLAAKLREDERYRDVIREHLANESAELEEKRDRASQAPDKIATLVWKFDGYIFGVSLGDKLADKLCQDGFTGVKSDLVATSLLVPVTRRASEEFLARRQSLPAQAAPIPKL